ncbi:hypothetical protein [Micromonospora kangleipakensis]|uniref:hypothetical protein n=1 Tax=Micromonospora kangleipakensis TaxID=1077942 RepID=UPI0010298E68|nr:hypothetical protein [Micromonospora kangleipakensis]
MPGGAGPPADVPATDNPEQIADQIRQTLTAAGFTDIVVRPAGPTDPAPRHAIVYAVSAGAGCVVGWGSGQQQVLGALPGGHASPEQPFNDKTAYPSIGYPSDLGGNGGIRTFDPLTPSSWQSGPVKADAT